MLELSNLNNALYSTHAAYKGKVLNLTSPINYTLWPFVVKGHGIKASYTTVHLCIVIISQRCVYVITKISYLYCDTTNTCMTDSC